MTSSSVALQAKIGRVIATNGPADRTYAHRGGTTERDITIFALEGGNSLLMEVFGGLEARQCRRRRFAIGHSVSLREATQV